MPMYPPIALEGRKARARWHRRQGVKDLKKAQTADKTWKHDYLGRYSDYAGLMNSAEWHMMAAETELMVMKFEQQSG